MGIHRKKMKPVYKQTGGITDILKGAAPQFARQAATGYLGGIPRGESSGWGDSNTGGDDWGVVPLPGTVDNWGFGGARSAPGTKDYYNDYYKNLPGTKAHADYESNLASGTSPIIDTSGSPEDTIKNAIGAAADPINTPGYYTGPTVAGFDDATLRSFDDRLRAADETDALTRERLAEYQALKDPNHPENIRRQKQAAAQAGSTFGAAGTFGSARHSLASNIASLDQQAKNREDALRGIKGAQADLTLGADLRSQVGREREAHLQNVINEDIKRWNFTQLSPQQQIDRIVQLATQLKALETGRVGADPGTGSGSKGWKDILTDGLVNAGIDAGSSLIEKALGSIFNEGGYVYRQEGGIIPGQDPMMQEDPMMADQGITGMGQDPMAPPAPPMMDQGITGMGQEPMMDEPMMPEMGISGMIEEEKSTLDSIEDQLTGIPGISIKRKTVKSSSKKGV